MTAMVREVRRFSASRRSRVPVSGSTSQATGTQPAAVIAWKEATKVSEGTSTSALPSVARHWEATASMARCRAAVPVFVVMTCCGVTPRYAANSSSNKRVS